MIHVNSTELYGTMEATNESGEAKVLKRKRKIVFKRKYNTDKSNITMLPSIEERVPVLKPVPVTDHESSGEGVDERSHHDDHNTLDAHAPSALRALPGEDLLPGEAMTDPVPEWSIEQGHSPGIGQGRSDLGVQQGRSAGGDREHRHIADMGGHNLAKTLRPDWVSG